MTDINQERPRPQYLAKLANSKKFKINYVTNTVEPDPGWMKLWPRYFCSVSVLFLLVVLDVAAVIGIVFYRISVKAAFILHGEPSTIFTVVSSSFIQLFVIYILSYVRLHNNIPININQTTCPIPGLYPPGQLPHRIGTTPNAISIREFSDR